MDIIGRINQRIGFTKTESRIVLFLVGMFMAGGIIRLVRGTEAIPAFDYSSQDSQFAAGVARLNGLSAPEAPTAGGDSDDVQGRSPAQEPGRKVSKSSHTKHVPEAGSVNINLATKKELIALPGIGESIAERIIAYRNQHGRFVRIEDLRKVKGIGKKKFAGIREFLTTGK